MDKYKIVVDSSADIKDFPELPFAAAPLKIITAEQEYIDDENLDTKEMVEKLSEYKGRSSTSCPNPEEWLNAFGEAENIFCITISSNLSGSYNAALVAKSIYEESYPERRVFVINSLSTGPEMKLVAEKIAECVKKDNGYETICDTATKYLKTTGILFMLESMKNLANNGRVNPIVAKAAGLLGIRVIGKGSENGELEMIDKCRGEEKALSTMVQRMKEMGLKNGKVRIAHCLNYEGAQKLKKKLLLEFAKINVEIYKCGGLCSFYAEKGGMVVAFEKF